VTTREGQQAAKINKDFFKEISVKEMTRVEFGNIIVDLHDKGELKKCGKIFSD